MTAAVPDLPCFHAPYKITFHIYIIQLAVLCQLIGPDGHPVRWNVLTRWVTVSRNMYFSVYTRIAANVDGVRVYTHSAITYISELEHKFSQFKMLFLVFNGLGLGSDRFNPLTPSDCNWKRIILFIPLNFVMRKLILWKNLRVKFQSSLWT